MTNYIDGFVLPVRRSQLAAHPEAVEEVVAVYLIQRNGFLSAYIFRLVYYTVWHITWGYLRLHIVDGM